MSEPLVSIVTPMYNSEAYLDETVQSVLRQTHTNLEYVIVDNHSKDRSGEIAGRYAAMDPRVRVLSPPTFLPQVKNFNFAVQQAHADARYVKLLASDDWIFEDCVRQTVAVAERDPEIALVGTYRLLENAPDGFGLPVRQSVFRGDDVLRDQLLGKLFPFGSSSTPLWRAEVVRERAPAFYPEDRFHFDIDVVYRVLAGKKFGFVHQVLNYSRCQEGAVTDQASHFNEWLIYLLMMLEQYGPGLLSREEYRARHEVVSSDFYRALGEVWVKDLARRKKRDAFWEFQREHLGTIGTEIDRKRLVKGVLDAGLHWIGHLSESTRQLQNRARNLFE